MDKQFNHKDTIQDEGIVGPEIPGGRVYLSVLCG
jgi:hypothetical protein